jgi:hypothetical protein
MTMSKRIVPVSNSLPKLNLESFALSLCLSLCTVAVLAQQPQPPSTHAESEYQIWDKLLIPMRDGGIVSATVAKKKDSPARLPALLTVDIYTDPASEIARAKDAADHGYVGVIADTRGRFVARRDWYFEKKLPNDRARVQRLGDGHSRTKWLGMAIQSRKAPVPSDHESPILQLRRMGVSSSPKGPIHCYSSLSAWIGLIEAALNAGK